MSMTFIDDLITVPICNENGRNSGTHRVCRWAYIPVNEKNVSTYFTRKGQDFQVHGFAQCKNVIGRKFTPSTEYGKHPMVAIRTYCTPETALTNCLYYHKYGEHRCNLALDVPLDAGVYAYTDAEVITQNLAGVEPCKAETVLGVVAGYLHKSQKKKGLRVSLDSRSCKLLGSWTQLHGPSGFTCDIGEEDRLSMRMDPEDLGVHSWRMSKIWNMTYQSQVDSLNTSGHIWAGTPMH